GGVPLIVDSQVVGAIGVSAGSEDQDSEVARAGVAALDKA
ncbi:MAG: heme-binding protein, partial [Acidobacteriota bacterium]|nr:heme-binding protein [Acidobacteriota bacterium]